MSNILDSGRDESEADEVNVIYSRSMCGVGLKLVDQD